MLPTDLFCESRATIGRSWLAPKAIV